MKTAISMPDSLFRQASEQAVKLGVSRSEFFSVAVERYLEQLADASLSEEIDFALDQIGGADQSSMDAVAAGHAFLSGTSDEW
jgi:metal-responsive CopG/Arc/MetJ family transcriptional regulator